MTSSAAAKDRACPNGDISAYIDGELSPSEEMALELHLAGCSECVADLNEQKQFLMALDMSLVDTGELKLPENFTKTVVASAESSVRGLRRGNELRNAAFICSGLFLIAILSVGKDLPLLMSALGVVVEKFAAVAALAGHFVFNVALGISVVFRSLTSQLVFGSDRGLGLLVVVSAFAVFAFSRLLARDGRA